MVMKLLIKAWNVLIECAEEIHEYRRKNPRINAWY